MLPALSALLPVRNAQASVHAETREILEVLSELSQRVELILIDDGSTDATPEVLPELASQYPQIRPAYHRSPQGRSAALRTGLARSSGSVLFFRDENCSLAIDEVHRLARASQQHEIVLGRAGASIRSRWGRRSNAPRREGSYQLVWRPVLLELQESLQDDVGFRHTLREIGCRWHEVEVRDRGVARWSQGGRVWADLPADSGGRPPRPNYLERLKDFALGE